MIVDVYTKMYMQTRRQNLYVDNRTELVENCYFCRTSNGETSMNANPGISGIISREVKNESSSLLLESSTPAKPVVDSV